jgi:glycerol-3-phosphate cytidylyltransferase
MIIGYTTGVFDLFHIGHVNVLKNAKGMCDKLIVGVSTDDLVQNVKNKSPVIPFIERCEILSSCKYVDVVIAQNDRNKINIQDRLKFDILFVGDDWYGQENWRIMESELSKSGVRVVFFPYTKGTSSTLINNILNTTRLKS